MSVGGHLWVPVLHGFLVLLLHLHLDPIPHGLHDALPGENESALHIGVCVADALEVRLVATIDCLARRVLEESVDFCLKTVKQSDFS